jgi:hypothetical protein
MKSPHKLSDWICYHIGQGIAKIYIIFDDPNDRSIQIARSNPNVEVILNDMQHRSSLSGLYEYDNWRKTLDTEVMSRQIMNVEAVMQKAKKDGMDWLIHIDSDEMINVPNPSKKIWEVYEHQGSNVEVVHINNYEVLVQDGKSENCFRDHKLFRTRQTPGYRAYYGTKSSARVNPNNHPHGVHHFKTNAPNGKIATISESEMVILHYVNCNFEEWKRKYETLGKFKDTWWGYKPINIEIHKKSRDVMQTTNDTNKLYGFYDKEMVEHKDPKTINGVKEIDSVGNYIKAQCPINS